MITLMNEAVEVVNEDIKQEAANCVEASAGFPALADSTEALKPFIFMLYTAPDN